MLHFRDNNVRLDSEEDDHFFLEYEEHYQYHTERKSSEETAFKWMKTMSAKQIQNIEESCEKPMVRLGYSKYSKTIINHKDILVKSAEEVWPLGNH